MAVVSPPSVSGTIARARLLALELAPVRIGDRKLLRGDRETYSGCGRSGWRHRGAASAGGGEGGSRIRSHLGRVLRSAVHRASRRIGRRAVSQPPAKKVDRAGTPARGIRSLPAPATWVGRGHGQEQPVLWGAVPELSLRRKARRPEGDHAGRYRCVPARAQSRSKGAPLQSATVSSAQPVQVPVLERQDQAQSRRRACRASPPAPTICRAISSPKRSSG